MTATSQPRRRRRTPEEAEREILDAAEAFLRERPFRDLTIDEVMERTELSRPSFYVYFRDRHHLALRLIEAMGSEIYERAQRWLDGDEDAEGELRSALAGNVAVYSEHGALLRAIAHAATEDAAVERAYQGVVGRFVDAVTAQIEREVAGGRARVEDPARTAAALVWMNERLLTETLGRDAADDPELLAGVLFAVWSRTIYGD